VPGCGKRHNSNGYCRGHRRSQIKYGDPLLTGKFKKICSVPGCGKFCRSHGYCNAHHKRWVKYGDPLAGSTAKGAVPAWISAHVSYAGDDCLKWPFEAMSRGQGIVRLSGGRNMVASRYMCMLAHGAPPTPEHEAAHSCGKSHLGCINPRHLRWATSAENKADMIGHGTVMRGEKNAMAKLTVETVRQIRATPKNVPNRIIAEQLGLSQNHVRLVRVGIRWSWVT
jgi:hypothetical protein